MIVKGGTPEFDYPKGKDNAYTRYDGADGIPIGGIAWRSLFAWYFGDVNILLSGYIASESKIMLHRNIQDRVETIAPFLQLDRDPYMAISEGRLYWIQDAYTTSAWFPYAKPEPGGGDINYIRNSVKIVIDAYNGTVTFYVTDAADPIIATYRRIFPSLFKPFDAMPPDLQKHIRYPEDLFTIQALQYRAYHMDAPEVFYNREDLWQFPREPTAPDEMNAGGETRMAPYYIMMRLPGEPQTEFFLMLPMTPSQRENMIAWLAARCDLPEYGKLIVYEFPKEKLVYGPFQIEARINQNTEISQQISLWNQMGSRVIRGNLLVVPIGELDPVRVAALSPRAVWPAAGTQAGDCGLWRACGDGGDAPRGPGRIVHCTPILLTHTPARCRVISVAGIKLGIGRRLCVASDAEQRTEGVERVEAPVEPKREFVAGRLVCTVR